MAVTRAFWIGVIVLVWPGTSLAQESSRTRDAAAAREHSRPHTQAEAGLGILTLPAKDICLTAPQTCTDGDIKPQAHVWMLYRPNRHWAVGAGVTYAPSASSDTPQRTPANLDREHKREYFMGDVTGRYYALSLNWLEGWVGVTAGAVVITDRYQTDYPYEDESAPILGPDGIYLRTEGLSAGFTAGLGWAFAVNWSAGASFRSAWWFLPGEQSCAPTGDCATLSGHVAMFTIGASVAYRISL